MEEVESGRRLSEYVETMFSAVFVVGRAGFEPATVRFLRVSLVGWVIPTVGRHLQRLRQPIKVLS